MFIHRKKINIAIIGCGRIAGHHIESIIQIKKFNLIAVCDLDLSKANLYAQKYKIKSFQNYTKMLLENNEIDFVVVATPSGNHFEISYDIIKNFNKNLIIEKPTFLKLEHFKIIKSLSNLKKLKIYPIYQNRFNKAVEKTKLAITNNEIGTINHISLKVHWERPMRYYNLSDWRGTYEMDGGVLTNQAVHHIDLLRYLIGDIKKIFSIKNTFNIPISVENSFQSIFQFCSGATGMIDVTTAAINKKDETLISILGSNGTIEIGGIAVNQLNIFTPNPNDCVKFSEDFSKNIYGFGHSKLYAEIIKDLEGFSSKIITLDDSFRTISLLHNFYFASNKDKSIRVNYKNNYPKLGRLNKNLYLKYRFKK